MSDQNIYSDPLEGYQARVAAQAQAEKESFVKMVLRDFVSPPIPHEPTATEIEANGLAIVYQPTLMRMWVTQWGRKIGPEFSTAIKLTYES